MGIADRSPNTLWYNAFTTVGESNVTRIDAIKEAIETLPEDEYVTLRQWFADKDWDRWDRQIEQDSKEGKLDFLVRDAMRDKRKGKLRDL